MFIVYSVYLIPENRIIYVGLTSRNPNTVLYDYIHSNKSFIYLFQKYGFDSLQINILASDIEEDKAYNIKEYYTNYYTKNGNDLLNVATGRNTMANHSKEYMQEHYKNTLGAWQKEHGNWLKGKKMPKEMVKHMSESRKGKPLHENTLKRLRENHPTAKPIYCLNNDKIYKSAAEAGRDLGLDPSSIMKVVKHQYTNTKGYVFSRPIYLTVEKE